MSIQSIAEDIFSDGSKKRQTDLKAFGRISKIFKSIFLLIFYDFVRLAVKNKNTLDRMK